MTKDATDKADVLIAGAGFSGLAMAIALKQALGDAFRVAVVDRSLANPASDSRSFAIAAAARRLCEAIGIWDKVSGGAQPILDMVVTDSKLAHAMRPVFLTFAGDVAPGEPFAHMVENGPLVAALIEKAKTEGVVLIAASVEGLDGAAHPGRTTATLSNGDTIATRLVVAADGARSRVRELAGIQTHGWSYGQSAIATTVAHERPHNGRAEEHFLPAGPFAILPLKGNRSSIVWTEEAHEADRIITLDDAAFHAELEKRFGLKLGDICAVGARGIFPLGFSIARSFIAERIALAGDAAHAIHPIAGQGLNIGLRDVAALAEAIVDAARLGLDVGSSVVLERYQRWRRFDTMTMGIATDGLNRLFSNESDVLRLLRDIGLGVVDRLPRLKDVFIRQAAGLDGEVPKLLKGEAL